MKKQVLFIFGNEASVTLLKQEYKFYIFENYSNEKLQGVVGKGI